jgi:hypothetical protein
MTEIQKEIEFLREMLKSAEWDKEYHSNKLTDATFRIVMLEKQIIDKEKESNGDKK